MDIKNNVKPTKEKLSRREFLRDASLGMAGVSIIASQMSCASLRLCGNRKHAEEKESRMVYRRLGRTGLSVSEIGLGGHYDGPNWQEKQSKEQWQREAVFKECLKYGINYFDTNDENERKSFGLALKSMPEIREQIFIVTDINDRKETGEDTYDFLMQKIAEQLTNLQLPHVDILRFTTVIKRTPPERLEAAIKAFRQIKKAGKAKFLAVAQHDPELLLEWISKYDEIDIIYMPYNYFASKAEEELFPAAKRKDIGVVVIKPFNKGTIFDPKLLETMKFGSGSRSVIERAEQEKKERTPGDLTKGTNLTLAQASLRYILSNENVSAVIPGMETVDEVRENIKVAGAKFGRLEHDILNRYAAHWQKALPENYQWLNEWRHA
jgi:aryl-alcohol dehydrogenase-like predicted oxidoreductase